jgi:hypothetical protein
MKLPIWSHSKQDNLDNWRSSLWRRFPVFTRSLLLTVSLLTLQASAATFVVTNLQDSVIPSDGSLRQAIRVANANGGGDIVFSNASGVIQLNQALQSLTISSSVNIYGPGPGNLIIKAGAGFGAFIVSQTATSYISGLTIRDCLPPIWPQAGANLGGGVYNAGNLVLSNCVVTSNVLSSLAEVSNGGGIYNTGTLYVVDCLIANNRAGLKNGPGPVPSFSLGQGAGVFNAGVMTIGRCTISANVCVDGADGYRGSNGEQGGKGGGVFNAGTLFVYSSSVFNNSSGKGGNGVNDYTRVGSGAQGGDGGGILNYNLAKFLNCTFSANFAGNGGSGADNYLGDGRAGGNGGNGGNIANFASCELYNCTITLGTAGQGGAGGKTHEAPAGYYIDGPAGANGSGGGIFNCPTGVVQTLNTILANNSATNGSDASGSINSLGHNLIQTPLGSTGLGVDGDLQNMDPMLGALANNGGPTFSHALLATSPAIDAGNDTAMFSPLSLLTDQRGLPRKRGLHVDIGAFEFDPSSFPAPTIAPVLYSTTLNIAVNPGGLNTTVSIEYGPTINYGTSTQPIAAGCGTGVVPVSLVLSNLPAGPTYHYRLVATSPAGTTYGPDQVLSTSQLYIPGDGNADGIVDQTELNAVLANYWAHCPWLAMTNPASLGGGVFQFTLTNTSAWNFSVLTSTNLKDWMDLPIRAYPVYQFFDPEATGHSPRFYRLRWP